MFDGERGRRTLGPPAIGCRCNPVGWWCRRVRPTNASLNPRGEAEWVALDLHVNGSIRRFQEKSRTVVYKEPVPQTNTGGWEENSKALERTLVKELGKLTP